MDRMKTFGIYALCLILFFVFSNIMINIAIKAMYNPINITISKSSNLILDVTNAKATYVNGYVEGNVKNTGENIDRAYVKIDLYSKRNVLLGTKYVTINDFRAGETREYKMGFKYTDVDYCKVSMVNEVPEETTEEQFSTTELKFAQLIATIVLICYFG